MAEGPGVGRASRMKATAPHPHLHELPYTSTGIRDAELRLQWLGQPEDRDDKTRCLVNRRDVVKDEPSLAGVNNQVMVARNGHDTP